MSINRTIFLPAIPQPPRLQNSESQHCEHITISVDDAKNLLPCGLAHRYNEDKDITSWCLRVNTIKFRVINTRVSCKALKFLITV